jgi:hypothetical protein
MWKKKKNASQVRNIGSFAQKSVNYVHFVIFTCDKQITMKSVKLGHP